MLITLRGQRVIWKGKWTLNSKYIPVHLTPQFYMLYIIERHPGTAYFKFQLEGQGCVWEEDTYNSCQFNVNSSFYSI